MPGAPRLTPRRARLNIGSMTGPEFDEAGARPVSGRALPGDEVLDRTLRPATFAEFIGQEGLKRNFQV